MNKIKGPVISPQSVSLYRLLLENKRLTAKEIGQKLGILPQAVYRAAKILETLGCLKKVEKRPILFTAVPTSESVNSYLFYQRLWFLKNFPPLTKTQDPIKEGLNVGFIQEREELLNQFTEDLTRAKKEVNLIVSGFEIPAETVLEIRRAIDRKVTIKIIAQVLNNQNREMISNWQKMGIKVRLGQSIKTRVIIIDSQITYLASFNPNEIKETFGVRFDYQPLAQLVQDLFLKQWKKAKSI